MKQVIDGEQSMHDLTSVFAIILHTILIYSVMLFKITHTSLIVACGSCSSDKRIEVVKLFGLLRSDGIFPR